MMQDIRIHEGGFAPDTPWVLDASKLLLEESEHKNEGYVAGGEEIEAFASNSDQQGHRLYTALLDDAAEALVAAAAEVRHESDASETKVLNIAVQKSVRGSGLGSLLMKQIAVHAAIKRHERLFVVSLEDPFFSQLGFTAIGKGIMVASPTEVIKA